MTTPVPPPESRLTPIRIDPDRPASPPSRAYWLCSCSCGRTASVRRDHIAGAKGRLGVLSCGCLRQTEAARTLRENRETRWKAPPPWLWAKAERMTGVSRKEIAARIAEPRRLDRSRWTQEEWDALTEVERLAVYAATCHMKNNTATPPPETTDA